MNSIESTFNVAYRGDSLEVRIAVKGMDDEFPFHNVLFNDETMRFWWQPLMRVDCELQPDDEGVYRGDCRDPDGGIGPMVMAPPNVIPRELVEVEESRLNAEKWDRRRELDLIDGLLGKMFDVGGTELNALVEGDGRVSVVLMSDIGDDLRTWDYVVDEVKDFARVMSYSRPGLGYSKESPETTSLEQAAVMLRELLEAAGVPPPFVLVGHAFGYAFARAFASEYPDDVAGMVFIDPVHPSEGARLRELDPVEWDKHWSQKMAFVEMLPEPVRAEYKLYEDMLEESGLEGIDAAPDVPAVVVSSLRAAETPRWVGETIEGIQVKDRLHREIAAEFTKATHVHTGESGRYIHREDPDLVIQAIREVVSQ
ncbi:MAG TPA: alpha/beta hydrolase, partial [Rhodothermales bacterium]|nr:alpha/beta hydrolase [Rhodothermales bacterium]